MKILCDTNIFIDVLLEREPFVEDSYKVLSPCEEHKIEGFGISIFSPAKLLKQIT